jgi:hypothetical protein
MNTNSNEKHRKYLSKGFFGCMFNSIVHTVMYTYYGLAACGPAIQKYLWWKKYITQIQLVNYNHIIYTLLCLYLIFLNEFLKIKFQDTIFLRHYTFVCKHVYRV